MVDVSNYFTHKQTYEPISTVTLSETTSSITFSSIPNTFLDLVLISNFTHGSPASNPSFMVRLGVTSLDTTFKYSTTHLEAGTSGVSSNRGTTSGISMGRLYGYTYGAPNTPSVNNISHFINYSKNSIYKTWLSETSNPGANSGAGAVENSVGLWQNTGAIGIISVALGSEFGGLHKFTAGSTFSLYGIAG